MHSPLIRTRLFAAISLAGFCALAQAQQTNDTQILEQIDRLLMATGSDKARILSATVYLADIGSFAEMNAAWDAWVDKGNPPARATVEARLAGPEYLVEIVVTAVRGKS